MRRIRLSQGSICFKTVLWIALEKIIYISVTVIVVKFDLCFNVVLWLQIRSISDIVVKLAFLHVHSSKVCSSFQ